MTILFMNQEVLGRLLVAEALTRRSEQGKRVNSSNVNKTIKEVKQLRCRPCDVFDRPRSRFVRYMS